MITHANFTMSSKLGKSARAKRAKKKKKDLKVSFAPTSVAVLKGFGSPGGRRTWRFSNRERVASIAGTSSGTVPTVTTFPLQPGSSLSFPWLSGEADKWEQYCFRRLSVEWIPASGSSGTGFACLSPEYDASDPNPTTIAQLANTEDAEVQRANQTQ